MKTFKDIKFEQHIVDPDAFHGKITFENGYRMSINYGGVFSDNPYAPYEVMLFNPDGSCINDVENGEASFSNYSVYDNLTEEQVEFLMEEMQSYSSENGVINNVF